MLALIVSGLVVPIVVRSRITKTIRIPAENATPKTGYQVKKKSGIDASRGMYGVHTTYRQAGGVPAANFGA